jgi:hypothetical protein
MRDLIRKIVEGYKSLKLEGQNEGTVVFSAQDPDTKQPVSIKVLPRLLDQDPQIARRFEALARTIRQLNHPNIASVRKVGEEQGLPYVVTRVIEKAQPLADKLDQPWAVDAAADLTMQVGQALEHAYNKGIVHGSLSPDNIVLDDKGRAIVSDFGLAELQNLLGVHLKQAVSPYLAPERLAGQPADAHADVYSLAAILYGLITKRSPQVVRGQVLPPSRFNSDVPEAMDAVVVKALAPNPADRYSDVRTFLSALGAITLAPLAEKVWTVTSSGRCPNCGAEHQTGRYCRRCGARLAQPQAEAQPLAAGSAVAEPIQRSKVEVGSIEVGEGVEMADTVIATPLAVAGPELTGQFPEPLEMPHVDVAGLSSPGEQGTIAMPEPLPMPEIDWAELVPPLSEAPPVEEIPGSTEGD